MSEKSKRGKQSSQKILKVRFRRSFRGYRALAIALGFLLLLVWAIFPLKYRMEQRKEAANYERKIEALRKENESLKREISRLKSDDYIEELARKELGLAKPGEEVYLVYEGDGSSETAATETATAKASPKAEKTFWQRMLELFRPH